MQRIEFSLILITHIVCMSFRMYRVRQHLLPLTNIEGSEDSDDEDSLEDNNHSFQVRCGEHVQYIGIVGCPCNYNASS